MNVNTFRIWVGCILAGCLIAVTLEPVSAQPGGRRGPPGRPGSDGDGEPGRGPFGPFRGPGMGPPRGPEFMRSLPLFAALDQDRDGELSADEIAQASKSLAKLDKDQNGKLTLDELRPQFDPRSEERGNPGGRRPGGPEEPGDAGILARLKGLDQDGDGLLSQDEAPERLRRVFSRLDADQDGKLNADELKVAAERMRGQAEAGTEGPNRRQRGGGSDDKPTPGGDKPKRP